MLPSTTTLMDNFSLQQLCLINFGMLGTLGISTTAVTLYDYLKPLLHLTSPFLLFVHAATGTTLVSNCCSSVMCWIATGMLAVSCSTLCISCVQAVQLLVQDNFPATAMSLCNLLPASGTFISLPFSYWCYEVVVNWLVSSYPLGHRTTI